MTRPLTIGGEPWGCILDHALSEYPREACGILLGSPARPLCITAVRPTRNATQGDSTTRYLVDPEDLLEAYGWAEGGGLEICGFYHTHPDHPPFPSEYDRETAWEGYVYLILSVRDATLRGARAWSWHPEERRFQELNIRVHRRGDGHEGPAPRAQAPGWHPDGYPGGAEPGP